MQNSGWVVGRPVLLIVACIYGALAAGAEDDNRSPVPDAVSMQAAEKLVRDVFGEEHNAARSTADKVALAKKMLSAAVQSVDAPAEQFVLFRVARDIAASAADAETAFKAVAGMGQRFRVDSLEMQVPVMEKISGKARLPSDHKALLPHFATVFDEAIASERFDVARQVHKLAMASAVKTRDVAARQKAAAWLKELDRLEKEFASVKQALAVLDERPTDPEANLVVGKYRCFSKGDWEAGLPMLALGGDAKLKGLATKELGGASSPSEQTTIGHDWWELAEKEDGKTKRLVLARAAFWYRRALPTLDGLARVKVEKRLIQASDFERESDAKPANDVEQVAYLAGLKPEEKRTRPKDSSFYYTPISIAGTQFPHGLYAHPSRAKGGPHYSYYRYKLDGSFRELRGVAGVRDGQKSPSKSPMTFYLVGDGKALWQSRPMRMKGEWQPFQVKIAGVKILELYVRSSSIEWAWAVWGDPLLKN